MRWIFGIRQTDIWIEMSFLGVGCQQRPQAVGLQVPPSHHHIGHPALPTEKNQNITQLSPSFFFSSFDNIILTNTSTSLWYLSCLTHLKILIISTTWVPLSFEARSTAGSPSVTRLARLSERLCPRFSACTLSWTQLIFWQWLSWQWCFKVLFHLTSQL